MPGPPTPVSSCPLRRLEIRDGFSPRIYHTCRPSHIFTLTLEGERPVGSETGVLILLIHQGQQRLISIRLHDLLKNSPGSTDIISVEKQRNEICIKIPGQGRAIIAQFEEKRDFSVAIYMLEKTNIRIKSSITSDLLPPAAPYSPTSFSDTQTASNFGPRLSSIAPLPRPSPYTQQTTSFTSMLNSPLLPEASQSTFGLHAATPQLQYPQRNHSLPLYASSSYNPYIGSDAIGLQHSPYSIFPGRSSSQVHTPRVSSPLRQSLNPEVEPGSSSGTGAEYGPYTGDSQPSYYSPVLSPSTMRTMSVRDDTHHQTLPKTTGRNEGECREPPLTLPSADASLGSPRCSEQSFRDLMPRPRELPFNSRSKTLQPQKVASPLQENLAIKQHLPKHKSAVGETEVLSAAVYEVIPQAKSKNPEATSESPTSEREQPQTSTQTEECFSSIVDVDQSTSLVASQLSTTRNLSESELTVLVTDPETLKQLNDMTEMCFEQYEVDIASGIDEEASAKFYLNRIMNTRKDFWLTKLGDMAARQWPTLC